MGISVGIDCWFLSTSLSKYANKTAITLSDKLNLDEIEVDIVYLSKQTLVMKDRCDRDENLF